MFHDPRQEFFGISVVEAMHHGVIPIVPNHGPYPELFAGIDIPSKNDKDLASTMFTLSHVGIQSLRSELVMRASNFCHTSQQELWTNSLAARL
jgi:glycosyltransferase involved in cell wall biosynthesis